MKLPDNFNIAYYAAKYPHDADKSIKQLVTDVKKRGYLTKSDLITLSDWKVPTGRNTLRNVKLNPDDVIESITRAALTPDRPEYDRIHGLCQLRGVGWAMASAILHWFHQDLYPIWDVRALGTIQFDESQYKNRFERWEAYVSFCRNVAAQNGVDMRTLDRALWQFSKSKNT